MFRLLFGLKIYSQELNINYSFLIGFLFLFFCNVLLTKDIPFIPPRGRKHDNLPDLDALLHRYETFVPNRGKRDKIKDMLKYDDLFYPNRGKKSSERPQKKLQQLHTIDCLHANNVAHDNDVLTSFPHWLASHLALGILKESNQEQIQQQLKSYLQQKKLSAIYNNDNNGFPQDMSMYKINGYDQSVKPSMPSEIAAKKISTAPLAIKNAMLWQNEQLQQQQQQLQHMLMMMAKNFADGDDAANRLQHLTTAQTTMRSMSIMKDQQQQQQQPNRRVEFEEQEELQHEQSLQDHQKSLTNFLTTTGQTALTPLFWRQLQLLQHQQPNTLMTRAHLYETRQSPFLPFFPLERNLFNSKNK